MLAIWVPKTERSRFAAVVYNGANFGTIVSIPLTGYLCSLEFMGGWPLSFYIFGVLGIVWWYEVVIVINCLMHICMIYFSIFWWWFVFDSPQSHPRISQEERMYIEKSLRNHDNELDSVQSNNPVPWKSIATSIPVWALLITTW
jgi:MFS transporter, ACS family, solute carrier family 17 (sodium-dependent inorganic phosphate cotransporter), member 5